MVIKVKCACGKEEDRTNFWQRAKCIDCKSKEKREHEHHRYEIKIKPFKATHYKKKEKPVHISGNE